MKKILIVIDMQIDFIDGSLGTDEAKAIVPNVVNKIKNFDGDSILFTLDTHHENYLETLEGKNLPVKHCLRNTRGWHLNDDVYNALLEKNNQMIVASFEKPTFGSSEMIGYISKYLDKDIEFEIVGLCTDICVISNALLLRALKPNSVIKCDSSCCAGVTPEKHNATLEVMKSCQIEVY